MRILVCIKRVPAPGAKINVTVDGLAVDATNLGFTTSPHEECALEEAVQIAERVGGEVTALTLGVAEAEEQLRYAASVGANKLVHIVTDGSQYDPQRSAEIIAAAVTTLEAQDGAFDMVFFGNESADTGGFQVGIRCAHALGRPIVNGIKRIEIEAGATSVRALRGIDGGFEVYDLPLPATLGIKEGINLPRYPTMKGRLASKKAELTTLEIEADLGGQGQVRLYRPAETVSETVILGEGPEAAGTIVDLLEEIGVMS